MLTKRLDVPALMPLTVMFRSNGDLNNGEIGKKSPKSQLSGLHRELGAILKEIKVIFSLVMIKLLESENFTKYNLR